MSVILKVENLQTQLFVRDKTIIVSDKIDLELKKNEILGLVGESGCGKTMTALSLTNLLPEYACLTYSKLYFDNREVDLFDPSEIKKIRAIGISYIFQEALTYLNPLFCIGDQIKESIMFSRDKNEKEAKKEASALLEEVGLTPAGDFYSCYPHQLSGGMNQRVMIAIAISSHPKVLIADEPTTALDVTIEFSIVRLIKELIKRLGLSVIWITHDISLIKDFADRLAVMYAGRIVEIGKADRIYYSPAHPFTKALLACLPENLQKKRFIPIEGDLVNLSELPSGCKFNPRCPYRMSECLKQEPDLMDVNSDQKVRCYLLPER